MGFAFALFATGVVIGYLLGRIANAFAVRMIRTRDSRVILGIATVIVAFWTPFVIALIIDSRSHSGQDFGVGGGLVMMFSGMPAATAAALAYIIGLDKNKRP